MPATSPDEPGGDAVPSAAAQEVEAPGADLDHAQHGAERERLRRRKALRPQQLDQDGADAEIDEGIHRDHTDHETEGASWNRWRRRRLDGLATIVRQKFPARREKRIERKVDDEHHRRIDEAGPAPAEPGAEERCGRPEDAAGKTRHQHQPADGILGAPSSDLVQHDIGAGRQGGAAAHAENDPAGKIAYWLTREEQNDVARHGDDGAHHHHLARTMPRKGLGEPGRTQAHGDIENRAAREHYRQAQAEIGSKVAADHGRKADRPPSNELSDGQHQQDSDEPAVRFQGPHSTRRLPGRRRSRL